MLKAQETVLEIDLKKLKHNYKYLKSRVNKDTKFLAVVKAFAYGNEASEIALCLENLGADYFAVAYIDEGVALRKAGVTTPILVLHPQAVNFNVLIENNLEPSIYNTKILKEFLEITSSENKQNYPIHIKFNTGLNRLGFWQGDVETIKNIIGETKSVSIKSIFSHLAASEDLNEKTFSLNQIGTFKAIAHNFEEIFGFKPMRHMCNTSGILNYPEAHFDMVRSGIGLYGFGNSEEENKHFKPIAALKTCISQIHHLEKGESVGYNRAFKSESALISATLPIGHADGLGRIYGKGKGFVTINGKKAAILGNVCMDMIMVDVTNISCEEGDEAIIFDGNATAETLAEAANTISYELITSISQRVKRRIIRV
ncbi:alanine racemase [Algibacter pacificus]|uniref:alanine racemase n=1 Tax=Algibacter pacificus TaxID=2599389 RepID=UPI0011C89001|nr:alanine racemase [Algibacter pacificus]